MAASYGYDISGPAKDVKEAMQWIYFGYLGAIKEQNGAAMSIGRNSTFLDIYAERDLLQWYIYRRTNPGIRRSLHHEIAHGSSLLHVSMNTITCSQVTLWTTESIGGVVLTAAH